MSYCAICDHKYRKGSYSSHKITFPHIASLMHRRSMNRWYKNNGS